MQDNIYEFSQGVSLKKTVLYDANFIIHQIINFMGLFLLSQNLKLRFYPVIAGRCISKVVLDYSYSSGFQF